jgi:hypothetical protein
MAEDIHDSFLRVLDLLKHKHSSFGKGTKVTELDLMFGNHTESLTEKNFGIVLQWLLVVSAWRDNIRAFDNWLRVLSLKAVSNPSLKTFRPIPTLRQNVADLRNALEQEKLRIEDEAREASAELQEITKHQVQSLGDVFENLLSETNALSTKASNEIQLVIGSVAIQVLIASG